MTLTATERNTIHHFLKAIEALKLTTDHLDALLILDYDALELLAEAHDLLNKLTKRLRAIQYREP